MRSLRQIHAAFSDGRLSFDKVRALIHVARPADEHIWLDIALAASSVQLTRIGQAFHRSIEVDDPQRNVGQHAKRTFNAWWREDGMLRLVATLPPEEGRLVLSAVEDAVAPRPERPAPPAEYSASDIFGSLRADALAKVAEHWLGLRQLSVLAGRVIDSDTAVAQDRGGAFDLGHASEVISGSVALAAARASPA